MVNDGATDELIVECTYNDECSFFTRSYLPTIALSNLDEHLQHEHDTDFETEIKRLEAEENQPVEEIVGEQLSE